MKPSWILVESKPKPVKEKIWLHKNSFFDFLDRVGISARQMCGLNLENKFPGINKFQDRWGATKAEIEDKILSQAQSKLEQGELELFCRLPYYLEYVYLGKNFYNDWGKTRTWEWLEDELKDGRSLAAGSKQASTLGADAADYWSTILGYRIVFDAKNAGKR